MNKKVLFVDDEPNVLQSIKRSMNKLFVIDTALSGDEALVKMEQNKDYAVLVSDMRMPGLTGVQLLSQARELVPDTVRIMLTGNADQQTAVDAVNQGDIFRFLNKPCNGNDLAAAVKDGIRQHELITAEKELLGKTLQGSIDALASVLALADPEVFGSTSRCKNRVHKLVEELALEDSWQYESAAMLSKIGCIAVPQELVLRKLRGESLSEEEILRYAEHSQIGAQLLSRIPRMEAVAAAVEYQEKNFDGSGYPADSVATEEIPLGARILKIVNDFDHCEAAAAGIDEALEAMQQVQERYDGHLFAAFRTSLQGESAIKTVKMALSELDDSTVIAIDVKTQNNLLLIAKGQSTTLSVRRHLQNFFQRGVIGNEVIVYDNSQ